MFSHYESKKSIDDRNISTSNTLFASKPIDVQEKLPSKGFNPLQSLQNILLRKDDKHKENFSFYLENDEDKEEEEEIKKEEQEVERKQTQDNMNKYLENSYLSQMYLGSLTVVGLYVVFRFMKRK
mgnify:CR=1 FL=1